MRNNFNSAAGHGWPGSDRSCGSERADRSVNSTASRITRHPSGAALGVLAGIMLAISALAQPANDNFVDAQSLQGPSGSITGDNTGATREPGEPFVPNTCDIGASIWYLWTAPANGAYTFNTLGSAVLDTTLGVYVGNTVDDLSPIAQNDDADPANGVFQSSVTFLANAGTTYHIAVDSYDAYGDCGGFPDTGEINLAWAPQTVFAGDFSFTSPLYIVSEDETLSRIDGRMADADNYYQRAKVTVTRRLGYTGRVLINVTVGNTLYTNYFVTNFFGTNVYMTNYTLPNGQKFFTNVLSTNVAWTNFYQNNEYGEWGYFQRPGGYRDDCTNGHLFGPDPISICSRTVVDPPPTNDICLNFSTPAITNIVVDTNSTPAVTNVTVSRTNIFCYFRVNITNVPTAIPFVDYEPVSGALVNDDLQTAVDVPIIIFPNDPDPPVNRVLLVTIDGVQLDPLESPSIPPPTAFLGPVSTLVNVLEMNAQGGTNNPNGNGLIPDRGPGGSRLIVPIVTNNVFVAALPIAPGEGTIGTNTFNIERATIQCTESVNGFGVARVWVLKSGRNPGNVSASINYRIDYDWFYGNSANDFFRQILDFNKGIFDWNIPEIPLQAASDYATPNDAAWYSPSPTDFTTVTGTLTFPPGVFQMPIDIPINDDGVTEFNEDLLIQLHDPSTDLNTHSLGYVRDCILTIYSDDAEQPAGSCDVNFNPDNRSDTIPPYNLHPGPNSTVFSVVVQPSDNKSVIGGEFTAYNTVPRNRITRVNTDGSLDTSFNPGSGADQFISVVAIDSSSRIMAAGGFTSYNGTQRNRIARITTTGGLDTTFNPGLGANGTIWALALQSDGKMIVGGEFTTFNVSTRHYVARLNTNGVEDVTFDPGTGPNDKVYAVAVQSDGKVIIGGAFTMVGTTARNHIARLNADGTLDITFDPGAGADGNVFSLIAQTDGNILLGGDFNNVHGANSKCIARLTSNGSLDLGFLPGSGADDVVYSMNLQPDQKILITGLFRSYNQTRRLGIARLYPNGILDTTFMDNAYNHFAGLPRHYFNASAESPKFVLSSALQSDGKLLIGGFFDRVGGGRAREAVASRNNFTRLIGGSTPGPGNIELTRDSYTADENGESVFITMIRTNGLLGEGSVVISPRTLSPGPGAAVAGVDFSFDATTFGNPTWISTWPPPPETWEIQDGTFGQNQGFSDTVDPNFLFGYGDNDVFINMIDNNIIDGNRQLNLELNNPKGAIESAFQRFLVSGLGSDFVQGAGLGGENIPVGVALGRSLSSLTIVDNDNLKGVLSFIVTNYTVSEGTKFASVLVIRTNGSSGSVQVNYATSDGTATTPADYIATAGTLTFGPGVTNQSFQVQIVNDSIAEDDETINLTLLNPSGGATLGVANATLTIIDNDSPNGRLNFSASGYITNENAGAAIITVNRSGGSLGTITVQAAATNGTALSGTHFTAVTNTLTWNPGEITPKTFIVPLIDNALVDGNHTVNLRLFGSTVNGNATNIIGGVNNVLLTIVDDDAYGTVAFTRGNYYVKENGGFATVTVSRSAGVAQSVTVNFATLQFEATQGYDYLGTNGTFIFGPGEISKSFTVPILDNAFQDGNRRVSLVLSNANPPQSLGFPSAAFLTIVDDELFNEPPGSTDTSLDLAAGFNGDVLAMGLQPNGMIVVGGDFTQANNVYRNRIARLNSSGSLDPSFSYPTGGADGAVRALLVQSDGRIVIGGSFTNVNGTVLNRLARLNYGGSVDTTFNIGGAADNDVLALAETFVGGERRILAAGAFLNINGVSRPGIARVTETGGVDNGFAPGLGANGTVYAVLAYPTNSVRYGQVIIAGDFTTVGGIGRTRIARLNVDGTVDQSFNPGTGANDSVRALAFQTDERILIGGFFTNFNGTARTRIARLNSTGLLDNTFTSGLGANDAVASIAVQPDGRILLGGQFTVANGITRHRITRLFADGTPDPTINFGLGADSFISSVLLQPDDRILIGGGFTHFDEEPHARFARLYGRSITGSGSFEFSTAHYEVAENGTNALISVRRRGGTSGATSVTMTTSNGTAIAGVNYVAVNTNLSFPPGEILAQITIPIIDDFIVNLPRTVNLALSNPQPPNGPSIGNQANADLTIINDDSAVSFSAPTYSVNEDISSGLATLLLVRSGSTNGPLSVDFATTTNGTAVAGVNYLPVTNTFNFAPGETNQFVQIPVLHNPAVEGDKTVTMLLSNVVGGILLDPSQATLTLIDVEHAPGQFLFSTTNYFVNEGDSNAIVTIVRTNGRSGVVSVHFATADATAIAGLHYAATNGNLTFGDGETNKSFAIRVFDDNVVGSARVLNVNLSNPTGGASFYGATNAPVTIYDNDVGISFSSPSYTVSEGGGSITLSVLRLNGSNDVLSVDYFTTTNGTATAGLDYIATSGTLNFAKGETLKTFTIPILEDTIIEGDEFFTVTLSNLQPANVAQLVTSTTTVTILDDDPGFAFSNTVYSVSEGGTNITFTVVRTNALTSTNSVAFFTSDGTATAGQDYGATSGVLVFTNGDVAKTITVPIFEDTLVEGDETFFLTLTNATGGAQVIDPGVVMATIVDNDAGVRFSSANYSVSEGGVSATITVLRTNVTTNTVTVNYATTNGTATAGQDYQAVSGTITFTNGEVSKTFVVPIIDDTLIEGDETVLLLLSGLSGQGSLISPSAAILTIVDNDGSLIQPAGSVLTNESGPVNGVIDPNEMVTMLFALRNVVGSTTTNLVATLLATNGVALPSAPQNYGALVPGGPSASRSYSFKATGTNGGSITAKFQLQDGSLNLGIAAFTYTLGSSTSTFSNNAAITIRDNTNAVPYPSTIDVSGLNGLISKVTVCLTNMNHTSSSDIDMLLVSPGGQKSLLLANNGGGNSMNNVTLTLDDAATNAVPFSGPIVSGTNRPNPHLPVSPFYAPAPSAPYGTNLVVFTNSNPNGTWSLFVIDDFALDSGIISNGWKLNITTANIVPSAADLHVVMADAPDPITVTSNLTYTITVTNFGPWPATSVGLVDTLPAGVTFVSAAPGGYVVNGGQVTFTNLGTLAKDAATTVLIVVQPTVVGTITNSVTAAALETDPNQANNTASVSTTVITASADLVLTMEDAPDPILVGNNLTYTLTISNIGPSTASTVRLTNTLPASVSFLSAAPNNTYTVVGNVVTFTNLGNLGAGQQTSASIVVKTLASGQITNSATAGSAVTDPLKANNFASVKTIVEPLLLGASRSGNNFVISWPDVPSTAAYVLESTPNLNAPITWTTVSNPPPSSIGGQHVVTVPATNTSRFFRLRGSAP